MAEKKKAEQRARAAEPNVATARDLTALGGDLTTADLRDPDRRARIAADLREPGRRARIAVATGRRA